jgi:hypothetical protein
MDNNIAPVQFAHEGAPGFDKSPFYDTRTQVSVPGFAAARDKAQKDALSYAHSDQGLVATGKLPSLNLLVHTKEHPNAEGKVRIGKILVETKYDKQGRIADLKVDWGDGGTEEVKFVNGKKTSDHVTGTMDLLFNYDSQGHVTSETIDNGFTHKQYEMTANGTLTSASLSRKGVTIQSIINKPHEHSIQQVDILGETYKFRYNGKLHFAYGTATIGTEQYGVQPDGQGQGLLVDLTSV